MSESSPSNATHPATPQAALETAYATQKSWSSARPHTLVVACSDGRIQENMDEFLQQHLSIVHYDRMYVPGGPGALVGGGLEFARPDQLRRECNFLLEAHRIEQVVLLFHGASDDGPPEASCADYSRKFPHRTATELNAQQQADVPELLRLFSWPHNLRIHIFRAEVTANGIVRFVDLQQG